MASLKYQPYRGYGTAHPWYWYYCYPRPYPRRLRTRSDWRLDVPLLDNLTGEPTAFWLRPFSGRRESRYQKQVAHRSFRREAKRLIAQELAGRDDVSQAFRFCGDWLD